MKKLSTFSILLVCSMIHMMAQIINVPADMTTIQAGIDSASTGDTVLVAEGTYYENINFLGKAITVASSFILDGDTSHISKTIIDGSQSPNSNSASAVYLISGEDTTSVLSGFTITGGTGTVLYNSPEYANITLLAGGAVYIRSSGGKICHNIIEGLYLVDSVESIGGIYGCAVFASVNHDHTVIIRNNWIRENVALGGGIWGGGIGILGGKALIEHNVISKNRTEAIGFSYSPGIAAFCGDYMVNIKEIIIRNNVVSDNQAYSDNEEGIAAGIGVGWEYDKALIYNNIISDNFSEGWAGGLYGYITDVTAYNNTIVNNQATRGGNSVWLDPECNMVLYNNIIWGKESEVDEIGFWNVSNSTLRLYYNQIKGRSDPTYPISYKNNTFLVPEFQEGTYHPAQNSPSIGRGIDSLKIGDIWVAAPAFDIEGNPRPGGTDPYVDVGAFESEYSLSMLTIADLASIWAKEHSLVPSFHKDTLNYLMVKEPGGKLTDAWQIVPADNLATLDIDTAQDLTSEDEQDRTTTILVTSSDGTVQKEYTIVYKYLTSDTTLASLEADAGILEPEFDPLVAHYNDTLPYGMKVPPDVICIASDTSASIVIQKAKDVYSPFEVLRTTTIAVTSPNGLFMGEYTVLFSMDISRPELTLLKDSVDPGDQIGVICSEPCRVYLVPANTDGIYDSIAQNMVATMDAMDNDTVYLSTEGIPEDTYWLYAVDRHQSVSENREVTVFTTTSIPDTYKETFRVYPSPAGNLLYIDVPDRIARAELYNVIGIPVLKLEHPQGPLQVGQLPEGIYILRVLTEKGNRFITRIIKE